MDAFTCPRWSLLFSTGGITGGIQHMLYHRDDPSWEIRWVLGSLILAGAVLGIVHPGTACPVRSTGVLPRDFLFMGTSHIHLGAQSLQDPVGIHSPKGWSKSSSKLSFVHTFVGCCPTNENQRTGWRPYRCLCFLSPAINALSMVNCLAGGYGETCWTPEGGLGAWLAALRGSVCHHW